MATTLALPPGGGVRVRDRHTLPLATLVAGAGIGMLIAGLIGAYLALRSATAEWPPADTNFDNYTATTLAITVLMASVMIEWVAYGIRQGFRGQALFGFGVTVLLGVAHLVGLAYLIGELEFGAGDSPYATVVYALLGVAFAVGVLGVGAVVLGGIRAAGQQISLWNLDVMRATAFMWHIVALAWIAVYYTVYISK